eukprot:scaffold160126_cov31-Tisochrysis_lutea.AAC.3
MMMRGIQRQHRTRDSRLQRFQSYLQRVGRARSGEVLKHLNGGYLPHQPRRPQPRDTNSRGGIHQQLICASPHSDPVIEGSDQARRLQQLLRSFEGCGVDNWNQLSRACPMRAQLD